MGEQRSGPRWRLLGVVLGVILLSWLTPGVFWPWWEPIRLRHTVRHVANELADGGDWRALDHSFGVYIITLNNDGDNIGHVNRDRADTAGRRWTSWLVGEELGGDRAIIALDERRGPHRDRLEVQQALSGSPGSGCWFEPERLVCWAAQRADSHMTHYVLKSSPPPWPWGWILVKW